MSQAWYVHYITLHYITLHCITLHYIVGVKQYLDGGVHDEAGDMHGAGLAQPVGPPHCLLQDGRVHGGLQQEHMVRCDRRSQS